MERLSLDAFKEKAETKKKENKELEELKGGILGACHWRTNLIQFFDDIDDSFNSLFE